MPISLVLDIIIAVLLVLTITYAVRLNQRLSQLRSDKKELQQLAKTFADATQRAETGIQNLKISSDALQNQIKKAEVLKDDLAYLVDRGSRTADEMVETVRKPSAAKGGEGAKFDPGSARAGAFGGARAPRRPAQVNPAQANPPQAASGQASPSRSHQGNMDDDDETRLIEDAIRAATPGAKSHDPAGRGDAAQGGMTRRIAGRSTGGPGASRGSLAARGLSVDADAQPDLNDATGLEDSASARELLKALSSVK